METKEKIISTLRGTGRENIEKVIAYMEKGFFDAPASVVHHNNFRGGLAKHSLEVYEEAMKLNEISAMPKDSITLCALLHDICKADQYFMSEDDKPKSDGEKLKKGHGLRSVYILTRRCELPLNYDEVMAIWWHMGEHERSKSQYEKEYRDSTGVELCKLIQEADSIAAKIE